MPTITINGREVHPDDIKVLVRKDVRVFVIWDFAEPAEAEPRIQPRAPIRSPRAVIVGTRR